ncbi:MAG: 2-C-methyl-D-erythritol 2,4-cyclodiphosphate synthase [Verrucomicrobiae bacterium]|nr:2-C-methyl-D-erythritol 2,4-cyclodiphosphate synthase [Verrucomicrobiae bacterium]MCX7915110.1 2-C-methyl-D-erythritol 2,4-cyclodiphosphate synthase [Verrucomicrobiae bacterium]MDW8345098.1 2-C-methyl-D-erythritol 2,4-cyclodiphosphate synthase [Verrucomicrobiae bacterium]
MNRVGIGIDVHPFAEGRKCIIGGVDIPHSRGLAGHSDADVLAHAVADAVLGAAALGDIGKYYPPSDPRCKDMDSLVIVRECGERLRAAGGQLQNVDAMIVAQEPRLAPHIPRMQHNLAQALGVRPDQVGVKATTSEYLGFTGRREGIVVVAIASVDMPEPKPVGSD